MRQYFPLLLVLLADACARDCRIVCSAREAARVEPGSAGPSLEGHALRSLLCLRGGGKPDQGKQVRDSAAGAGGCSGRNSARLRRKDKSQTSKKKRVAEKARKATRIELGEDERKSSSNLQKIRHLPKRQKRRQISEGAETRAEGGGDDRCRRKERKQPSLRPASSKNSSRKAGNKSVDTATRKQEQEGARQDRQPQGMALARKLMHDMGWSGDGHGLGLNGTGISKPISIAVKVKNLGIGARHESSFAKQARLFKEMEDEAFPDFLTGPPGDACGDMAATQWADAGEQPERRLDRQDKPVAEEGSSVSTSDCTSSSSASMPEATRQSAAGNISDAPPIRAPSKMPKVPFHRVQANDPEVEEFKRKTGYDYVHRRFKVSDARNSVGDRGSMSLNPLQGSAFKKRKQKLKDRSTFGSIDVNFRNSNRVVFNYDDD